jgi:hypothetical protein
MPATEYGSTEVRRYEYPDGRKIIVGMGIQVGGMCLEGDDEPREIYERLSQAFADCLFELGARATLAHVQVKLEPPKVL